MKLLAALALIVVLFLTVVSPALALQAPSPDLGQQISCMATGCDQAMLSTCVSSMASGAGCTCGGMMDSSCTCTGMMDGSCTCTGMH
ncbi:MAG TPA: hypothetical protein VE439_11925 [Anaerolineae bacterium]|nr:hypothetical protein [Anaerolineae bacterium]